MSIRLSCRTKSWKVLSWGNLNWKALQKLAVLVKSRFGKFFIPDRARLRDSGCLLHPVWVRGEGRKKHWGTVNKHWAHWLGQPQIRNMPFLTWRATESKNQKKTKKHTNSRTERRHKVNDTVVCIIGGPLETEVRKERFNPSLKSKHTKRELIQQETSRPAISWFVSDQTWSEVFLWYKFYAKAQWWHKYGCIHVALGDNGRSEYRSWLPSHLPLSCHVLQLSGWKPRVSKDSRKV